MLLNLKHIEMIKKYYLVILAVVAGLASCDKDDEIYPQLGDDPRNLSEIISETQNLSSLYGALESSGLDSTLRSTTTYTVFAPNNSAFDEVDISGLSETELENILLNHILSTTTADFSSTLSTGYTATMAIGPEENNLSLFLNTEGGISLNGTASLIANSSDIGSTNGVLHQIDGVLLPPTVYDHTQANPNFSMLSEAIELAGLDEALSTTATDNELYPFTVFAPTNTAFENFMMQLNGAFGWENLSDIPADLLQEVLEHHVVSGANTLSAVIAETEQTTLQGEILTISADAVISDASYTNTNFTTTDIQGINGVVHGVDKVLLPEDVFQQILGATLNLKERSEDRGYSSFLAAVEKAGLTSILEDEEQELTAFIPNNDAFTALFAQITNFESLNDFESEEELEALSNLLMYHLREGVLMSSQLTDGGEINTLFEEEIITADLTGENARLRPSFEDAIPSGIVNSNIGATNGLIHEINRVLIPNSLVPVLGIPSDEGGKCPVGDEELVFFNWDDKGIYWGNVTSENDASLSPDGSSYGRVNFQTGGTGWQDLFWRNDDTFYGADVVSDNLEDYVLKFDINVIEPISEGMFRIRFNDSDGVDAFYDWQPWNDTGEPYTTDGWETVEIPLSVLGVPDFSLVDAEFGMAFEGADVLLNFAIDNVRFDTPGCGGPEPVANSEAVFFDWDGKDPYWGNTTVENDPSISLDGSNYGRTNFQTGGTGWQDLFWRNDDTFFGADMVGSNLDDYNLKFDIYTLEPISEGIIRIRFNATSGVDAFYDWQPWNDTGEAFDTGGSWTTVSIPASVLNQPDFSLVDAEFGMAFEGADTLLNFAIDNVRFEER